tara:strand:- start:502 stop:837 length:336 start_codon:yes stop_codon:yes gene_type:complete
MAATVDQAAPRPLVSAQRATGAAAAEPLALFLVLVEQAPTCLITAAIHPLAVEVELWAATTEAHGLLVKLLRAIGITGHQPVPVLLLMAQMEVTLQHPPLVVWEDRVPLAV